MTKLALSIEEAAVAAGSSRTVLFREIREGRLQKVKVGRRTLILEADLKSWLDGFAKSGRAA